MLHIQPTAMLIHWRCFDNPQIQQNKSIGLNECNCGMIFFLQNTTNHDNHNYHFSSCVTQSSSTLSSTC